MENGYMITYHNHNQFIDQSCVVGKQDAMDHVNVAMEMEGCDCITFQCIDRRDVLYTVELFKVDGKWTEFYSNNVMNTCTLVSL